MRRVWQVLSATALVLGPGMMMPATACLPAPPRFPEFATSIASNGVFISGRVIQEYDQEKGHPQVIRAENVFIGDETPTDFEISRIRPAFLGGSPTGTPACDFTDRHKVGYVFQRVFLRRVPGNEVRTAGWDVVLVAPVWDGPELNAVLAEARRANRLRKAPPPIR
ncbi:MAG: hypothetical protein V4530_06985 [Pseudomonadota bacterium]